MLKAWVCSNPGSVTTSGRRAPICLRRAGNSAMAPGPKMVAVGNENPETEAIIRGLMLAKGLLLLFHLAPMPAFPEQGPSTERQQRPRARLRNEAEGFEASQRLWWYSCRDHFTTIGIE